MKSACLCPGDYLFGNETEACAYAEAVGWDTQARKHGKTPSGGWKSTNISVRKVQGTWNFHFDQEHLKFDEHVISTQPTRVRFQPTKVRFQTAKVVVKLPRRRRLRELRQRWLWIPLWVCPEVSQKLKVGWKPHLDVGQNGRPLMGPQIEMSSLVLTIQLLGYLVLTHRCVWK